MDDVSLHFTIAASDGPFKGKVITVVMGKAFEDKEGASQGWVIAKSIPLSNIQQFSQAVNYMADKIGFYFQQKSREPITFELSRQITDLVTDPAAKTASFRVKGKITKKLAALTGG
mgnify:CR=1 FL=1|tara:strand:- start:1318 stop:1665 length:348 start_codon:yes stop_codon:yes gene_type:complete